VPDIDVKTFLFEDDGSIPNHPTLPLLLYPNAIDLGSDDPAATVEEIFRRNGWGDGWRNGIYSFPHYHSNAHEVLGVYRGSARVRLGGANGVEHEVKAGDVIVIPAGVGHENLGESRDFAVVGAYPSEQSPDLCRGEPDERSWVDDAISRVVLPTSDPVAGPDGPLLELWGG
jgi:uncharacterized protein YjlB